MTKQNKEFTERWVNERLVTVEEQMATQREYDERTKFINENWFWKMQLPTRFRGNEDAMRMAEGWKKEGVSNDEIEARLWTLEEDWRDKMESDMKEMRELIDEVHHKASKSKVKTMDHPHTNDKYR